MSSTRDLFSTSYLCSEFWFAPHATVTCFTSFTVSCMSVCRLCPKPSRFSFPIRPETKATDKLGLKLSHVLIKESIISQRQVWEGGGWFAAVKSWDNRNYQMGLWWEIPFLFYNMLLRNYKKEGASKNHLIVSLESNSCSYISYISLFEVWGIWQLTQNHIVI